MTRPLIATRLRHHTPAAYSAVVLADTPLAYWRCSEAAGAATLADSSGNARTATINGTVTTGVAGRQRLGNAATFAVSSGYLSVASSAAFQLTGNATWECWYKLTAAMTAGAVQLIHCCGVSGETSATNVLYQFDLQFVSSGVYSWSFFHESGSGTNNTSGANFSATLLPHGVFNHLVLRRDVTANTYELFLNGAIVGTPVAYTNDPSGGGSTVYNFNRNPAVPTISNRECSGDEIAVYSTKLTDARIFEHYRAGRR
jgi:hypothetical protein